MKKKKQKHRNRCAQGTRRLDREPNGRPSPPRPSSLVPQKSLTGASAGGKPRRLWVFFSSRRRHTRLQGDWSSDVCSSDLCSSEQVECPGRAQSFWI